MVGSSPSGDGASSGASGSSGPSVSVEGAASSMPTPGEEAGGAAGEGSSPNAMGSVAPSGGELGGGGAAGAAPSENAAGGAGGGVDAGASDEPAGASAVEPSAGCGAPRTLQNGTLEIPFGGATRKYILRVPDEYDNTHPYRLVFAFAESGASAESVASRDYFRLASLDGTNTIFVAPDAADGAGSWSDSDVELTDEILAQVQADLCIDKKRIFATGFSFGGAMCLALACQRAEVFRGVAFFSGADLTGSCTQPPVTPIAYYASQASGDSSGDPIPSSGRVKQAQFAEVNGCTPEPEATTFPAPGEPHECTVYEGCSEGHPTVYCVFDGPHGWEPTDPGESTSWNAPAAWEFITQF